MIGTGGKVIREITETTGTKIDIEDDGTIKVAAVDAKQGQAAIDWIKGIVAEPEIGVIYTGKVVKTVEFGAFVNFLGARDGLVHISELAPRRVAKVNDVVKEGDQVKVKVLGVDDRGKVRLSHEGGRPGDRRGHLEQAARGCGACAGCRRVRHQTVTKTAAIGPPFLFVGLAAMKTSTSRRLLLAGAGASLLPLRSALAAGLIATPQQTEGPFYPTAFPTDMDNDLVQVRGQQARAMGTVLHLEGRVLDLNGKPVDGALVEIWQCDAQGIYDHPRQSGRDKRDSAFQGYGRLLVKADGRYSFRTLKPVAYVGRSPHIHFKVATATGKMLTSQFYIAGDPGNERDGVFRGIRDPRQRELVEMKLRPRPGSKLARLRRRWISLSADAGARPPVAVFIARIRTAGVLPLVIHRGGSGAPAVANMTRLESRAPSTTRRSGRWSWTAACRWRGSRHRHSGPCR